MEKLWMRAGTRLWPTPTRTCRSLVAENLSLRRCIISCVSMERTGCTPATCQGIRHPMAVSACPSSTPSRFSTRSVWALQLRCLEGRRPAVTGANHNLRFRGEAIALLTRASAHNSARALLRRHGLGGREARRLPKFSTIGASRLGSAGKIDEIGKNIERLVALWVDRWLFRIVAGPRSITD
jgi:hypothetical protein